jgi:hypothetical protein
MTTAQSSKLAIKLSEASIKMSYSPFDAIAFPETLEKNQWYTGPELITLYGTSAWEALSEDQKKILSFYEAVNFYSLNINGEKALIEGLAKRLYDEDRPSEHTQYIHHFLEEENKHMTFFGNFCMRYAGKVYQDRKFNFSRDYLDGEEEFLFFLKVFIFEEIADYFNVKMGQDKRLHPVAQKINYYHHVDESRHLAFGRAHLKEVWEKFSPTWGESYKTHLTGYISQYLVSTWREYYNPDVYADAGIQNAYELAETIFTSSEAMTFRKEASTDLVNYLIKINILPENFERFL